MWFCNIHPHRKLLAVSVITEAVHWIIPAMQCRRMNLKVLEVLESVWKKDIYQPALQLFIRVVCCIIHISPVCCWVLLAHSVPPVLEKALIFILARDYCSSFLLACATRTLSCALLGTCKNDILKPQMIASWASRWHGLSLTNISSIYTGAPINYSLTSDTPSATVHLCLMLPLWFI